MKRLDMRSPDMTQQQLHALRALFPHCVTEAHDEHGNLTLKVDFDLLRQELTPVLLEGHQERYQLNWPGKRQAIVAANTPIAKTLRPAPHESVAFDNTQHIFIEGDNLDALKLLQETYLGKVKLIYIDPPYNTGNDFIYRDNYAISVEEYQQSSAQKDSSGQRLVANSESNGRFHSDWLSMMYPRLKLARNLLREDGVIFISIDDNEVHNLKKLCDEIFGEENFISVFIWEKRSNRENRKMVSTRHDYIVCFAKNLSLSDEAVLGLLPMNDEAIERYHNPDNDPRGDWTSVPAIAQAGHATPSQFYALQTPSGRIVNPPSGSCWRYTKDKMLSAIADNRIWFGTDGNGVPRIKKFLNEGRQGLTPETLWWADDVGTNDSAKRQITSIFDSIAVFDTPKPRQLIQRIVQLTCKSDSIILDFFAGSATTAHAVMQLNAEDGGNRQFIMVQLPEVCAPDSEAAKAGFPTIAEISKERIRRAGTQILAAWHGARSGASTQNFLADQVPHTPPDVGFRVLKIDSSNMREVFYVPDTLVQGQLALLADNIKPDRTDLDLLFQVMLDWGIELSLPIRQFNVGTHTVYSVADNALVACFGQHIDEGLVRELTTLQPLRLVFRDSSFANDAVKINVGQIVAQRSPHTEIRVI